MPRSNRRVTRVKRRSGSFAKTSLTAFVFLSVSFGATLLLRGEGAGEDIVVSQVTHPEAIRAEAGLRVLLDERIHLHLKRLQVAK